MILLTHQTRILLCVTPSDFRKGIDGFVAVCKNELLQDPRDGCVFVFINRSATMIRALSYDGTGFWLMTKRLSRGRFKQWPSGRAALSRTSAAQLRQLLSGGTETGVGGHDAKASVDTARASTMVNVSI